MTGPIVVPLDGSTFAEVAIPMGRLLSDATGAELHLVHVMTPPIAPAFHPEKQIDLDERVRKRSLQYLGPLAAEAGGEEASVRTVLLPSELGVGGALAEYADGHRASWLVLTTHGGGGLSRWMVGSVADTLVRRVRTPLLLLRPWDVTGSLDPGEKRFERVMVSLDGSEAAEAALAPAAALARAFGASLELVRVVPPRPEGGLLHGVSLRAGGEAIDDEAARYLRERVGELREAGLASEAWLAAHDDPAEGLLTAAAEQGADALVASTHGRGGIERAVLGSVADRLLQKAAIPLVLVRTPAEPAGESLPSRGG